MNKIYKAFDSIKLDNTIKQNAYQKIRSKSEIKSYLNFRNLMYSALGLVFTTVLILLFVNDGNTDKTFRGTEEVDTLYTTNNSKDIFLYDNHVYSLVYDYDISTIIAKEELGTLREINSDDELTHNFDSYYHDGCLVYNSNEELVLIVKDKDTILVYKR